MCGCPARSPFKEVMNNSLSTPPAKFLSLNDLQSKNLVVVVDIDGLDYLTSQTVLRSIQYGDPYVYGDDIVYGSTNLVPVGSRVGERGQKDLLIFEGSTFTISQKLEPEQGRASISTLSLSFLDKDQYMTMAVASGPIVDEILGRQMRVWIGYKNTSFPEDYFVVWRGRVGQVNNLDSRVNIQFVDPNVARRQQIFYTAQSVLSSSINDSTTTIPLVSNGDYFRKILGPSGAYDQDVRCFIKIDDEYIEYQQTGFEGTGFGTNEFLSVVRGAEPYAPLSTPSVAAAHDAESTVDSYIELSGNAMEMALKIMMSGWNGPFLEDQQILSLSSNRITLPNSIDAIRDLGISTGDYFTISGSVIPGNNISGVVTGYEDIGAQTNRVLLVDQSFSTELSPAGVLAIRSQYDVWPTTCGTKLPGWEVDVGGFQYLQNTYLSGSINSYNFLISSQEAGKTFIESQLLLPLGAYSLTRQGKISVGLTKPPIADQRTQVLTVANVVDPRTISVQRGVNNRKFFNQIDWTFDYTDDGVNLSSVKSLDTDSLNIIGMSSVLPQTVMGGRTDLGFEAVIANRDTLILNRYSRGCVLLNLKTTFGVGNQVEVGDILVVQDQGELQIPNFTTGVRNIGIQFFEVINRTLDLITGVTSLTLQGGTGANVSDRYGTVSPSSYLTNASTTTALVITGSFGEVFPGQEYLKWSDYVGLNIRVHSEDYSDDDTVMLVSQDPSDPFIMNIVPALSFTPTSAHLIDIAEYPDNTDQEDQALYKIIHAFIDPSIPVVSGVSEFAFTVDASHVSNFHEGFPVLLHNDSYSFYGPSVSGSLVTDISGVTITVEDSFGFSPNNTMTGELIGMPDVTEPYRLI